MNIRLLYPAFLVVFLLPMAASAQPVLIASFEDGTNDGVSPADGSSVEGTLPPGMDIVSSALYDDATANAFIFTITFADQPQGSEQFFGGVALYNEGLGLASDDNWFPNRISQGSANFGWDASGAGSFGFSWVDQASLEWTFVEDADYSVSSEGPTVTITVSKSLLPEVAAHLEKTADVTGKPYWWGITSTDGVVIDHSGLNEELYPIGSTELLLPISFTKTVESLDRQVGDKVTFRLTVSNDGLIPINDVTITDFFNPEDFAFVSAPENCEHESLVAGDPEMREKIECDLGTLAGGEDRSIEIEMVIMRQGQLFNRAFLNWDEDYEIDIATPVLGLETADDFMWQYGGMPVQGNKTHTTLDLYLGDTRLANDINFLDGAGFSALTVTSAKDTIVAVAGDAPDTSSPLAVLPIEFVDIEDATVTWIGNPVIVISGNDDGTIALVAKQPGRATASDPAAIDVLPVHVGRFSEPIDLGVYTSGPTLESGLTRNSFGAYHTLTPGMILFHVDPSGETAEEEVFRMNLNEPGEVYLLVVGPPPFGSPADMDFYAVNSRGEKIFGLIVTGHEAEMPLPASTRLFPVYPNPFSRTANIRFQLARPDQVILEVFDITGRIIRSFCSHSYLAGEHAIQWDGGVSDGTKAPSGTYILRMTAFDAVFHRSVTIVR